MNFYNRLCRLHTYVRHKCVVYHNYSCNLFLFSLKCHFNYNIIRNQLIFVQKYLFQEAINNTFNTTNQCPVETVNGLVYTALEIMFVFRVTFKCKANISCYFKSRFMFNFQEYFKGYYFILKLEKKIMISLILIYYKLCRLRKV